MPFIYNNNTTSNTLWGTVSVMEATSESMLGILRGFDVHLLLDDELISVRSQNVTGHKMVRPILDRASSEDAC